MDHAPSSVIDTTAAPPTLVVDDLTTTSVTVQGLSGDLDTIRQSAVNRVCLAVNGAIATDSNPGASYQDIHLPGGADLRVLLTRPTPPRAHAPHAINLLGVIGGRGVTAPSVLDAALTALRRAPLTEFELAELREQMPLTTTTPTTLPPGALSPVAPVMVIHHMTDFLIMVEAVIALGVPPELITVLDKGYPYRNTERVDAHLRATGVRVFPYQQTRDALADHVRRARAAGRASILLDDGGYTTPVLLTELPELAGEFIGLVEQTISGITRLRQFTGRLPMPVFSVAQSRIKATVESYGIADVAVRNVLSLLPQEKWEGQAALVVGYGRIGQQVAEVLRARRLRVAVFDTDTIALLAAHERGLLTGRDLPALIDRHEPKLIVGTTGATSVHGSDLLALRRDTYLVSVTSRQRELAIDEFARMATGQEDLGKVGTRYRLPTQRTATVLADGFPVNFHHAESLPNRYSDLILAAMILGAATLAAPGHGFGLGHNVEATDAAVAASGLAEAYYLRYGPRP